MEGGDGKDDMASKRCQTGQTLEKMRSRGDLIEAYKIITGKESTLGEVI